MRRILLLLTLAACGGDPAVSADFERAARETAPVITADFQQSSSALVSGLWAIRPDYVRDRIYGTLCDPDDTASCTVGVENVYHALADVDGAAYDTTGGEAAGSVTVPFFGGVVDYESKRPAAGLAWRVRGSVHYLLYVADKDSGTSVYQVELDHATGDFALRMAGFWQMSGQGSYGLRAEIDGNRDRHEFTLRIATSDPLDSGKPFVSFRGAGTSRGAGNHFLFHVTSTNTADGATEDGYHCVDAATMTDVAGNQVTEVHADCGSAATTVDGLTALNPGDLPAEAIASTL